MIHILPSPPVTGVIPVKQLIAVVFPAPLGPSRQNNWSFAKFTHKPWRFKENKFRLKSVTSHLLYTISVKCIAALNGGEH